MTVKALKKKNNMSGPFKMKGSPMQRNFGISPVKDKEGRKTVEQYASGKKEVTDNTATVRKLGSDKQEIVKREDLIKNMLASNKLPLN